MRLPVLDNPAAIEGADQGRLRLVEQRLKESVRGHVRFGHHDRMLYATDASLYQVQPLGVVIPADIDDAVEAVRVCAELGVPVLPRGGGTSLAGQCTARAVVIDVSSTCLGIGEVTLDAEGSMCTAQPGVTVEDLNDAVRAQGLFFAPDPATARHATIGGCIGNNAAGTRSVRYGRTSENVAWIDACLADGTRVRFDRGAALRDQRVRMITERVIDVVRHHEPEIRARYPKTIRRNAGYALDMILAQLDEADRTGKDPLGEINLTPLLCGSEGTLAFTLSASVKLRPLPAARGLAIVGFESLEAAIDAVVPILETEPVAVELLDDMVISLARKNPQASADLRVMPKPPSGELAAVLYVEYFTDGGQDQILESFSRLEAVVPGATVQRHTEPATMAQALRLRKSGEPLLHGVPGARKPITFVEDNAVPVERLSEFVRRFKAIVAKHGTIAAYYAHASVGVLHVRPLLDIKDDDDRVRMERIATEVADLAQELGGVMSGEHGDGRVRGPLLERFFGTELFQAFGEIKHAFDPENRLNPGNIIEPRPIASIHTSLRVQPGDDSPKRPQIDTYFDYSDQHGYWGAVEMCNGAGVCRKKTGGTMCPSYMGTLDERHSTRGRGNALRLAAMGQVEAIGIDGDEPGKPNWDDPETKATLDLCLSCKACKAECPSNVDIARLKAEHTAQGFRERGGADWRSKLFANVRVLNRLGSILPSVTNALNTIPPIGAMLKWTLGVHMKRSLPSFSKPLPAALRRTSRGSIAPEAPTVLLFGDCFTMYNESKIGVAARDLLEAFGYNVVLADVGCCGRSAISMGVLEDAIDMVDAAISGLETLMAKHDAEHVLYVEPSCHSAAVDDWLSLNATPSRDRRGEIARRSQLVEAFLESNWHEHPTRPEFDKGTGKVVLHAHCHQRATVGHESNSDLLERAFPGRIEVLDSGCCGMAGSFGFMKHKFDLSMRIGERVLLPSVRSLAPHDELVATGTSCRHQVLDGAGAEALHPVELLANRLQQK